MFSVNSYINNSLTRYTMDKLTELRIKASTLRSKLAKEEDAEKQDALVTEYGDVEREIRNQMVLDDKAGADVDGKPKTYTEEETDGADKEYREMVEDASIGAYFNAAREQAVPEGVERELQQHHKLQANQMPIDVMLGTVLEERQAAPTPPPAETGLNQQPIEPYVFPNAAATFLGVRQPRVAAGTPLYPDVAKQATVEGPYQASESVAHSVGQFQTVSIAPARFQASFFYRRTDAAKFAGMDSALRANLSSSLMDQMDKEVITRLIANTDIAINEKPTAAAGYNDLLSFFAYRRVDGRWAPSLRDVRSIIGTSQFEQLALAYAESSSGAQDSVLNMLNTTTGGTRVSAHVPAVESSIQTAITRLGMRRDAVFPIWEGLTLINDEITRAASGEIVITAVMLANFKLLRAQGFHKVQTFHA